MATLVVSSGFEWILNGYLLFFCGFLMVFSEAGP